jgi:hypothetical protein
MALFKPEIGEQCEPGVIASADLPCCLAQCQLLRHALATVSASLLSSVCDANGHCKHRGLRHLHAHHRPLCSPSALPTAASTASVVSCFASSTTATLAATTVTTARATSLVSLVPGCHDFWLPPVDCGGNPPSTSCFACIAVTNTPCWDPATGNFV